MHDILQWYIVLIWVTRCTWILRLKFGLRVNIVHYILYFSLIFFVLKENDSICVTLIFRDFLRCRYVLRINIIMSLFINLGCYKEVYLGCWNYLLSVPEILTVRFDKFSFYYFLCAVGYFVKSFCVSSQLLWPLAII